MIFLAAFVAVFLLLWLGVFAVGPATERVLARTAHWTAQFRYRDYLPVIVVLAVGIAATAMAGDGFIDIAEGLHEESPALHAIDAQTHAWARFTRTPGATLFFTTLTLIGTPVGIGILVLIVSVLLAFKNRYRWAAYLIVTTTLGGLLNLQLKSYFARARPELAEALRSAHGYSFPSGHAMGSAVCFGALAYLALRTIPRWRHRAAAIAFAGTMILAISASRIYLGVHWISDVGAGICAGLIWVIAATVAYETMRRIRTVRSLRARRDAQTASSPRTSRGE
ncbi:MAG TPA: phosphatase PAP2 family protein [Thermoanaerobaculia bacterium]|nr:phosphatase PAP2 family protein [Thermoanaerobaculia bacterium]